MTVVKFEKFQRIDKSGVKHLIIFYVITDEFLSQHNFGGLLSQQEWAYVRFKQLQRSVCELSLSGRSSEYSLSGHKQRKHSVNSQYWILLEQWTQGSSWREAKKQWCWMLCAVDADDNDDKVKHCELTNIIHYLPLLYSSIGQTDNRH